MQVPQLKITQEHLDAAADQMSGYELMLDFINKVNAIALAEQANQPTPISDLSQVFIPKRKNAEQSQEQPLISAEEARKLGAGNAEYRYQTTSTANSWSAWFTCTNDCVYREPFDDWQVEYRAIKQPEPVKPHAELRAMYEQQAKNTAEGKAGGLEDFDWEFESNIKYGDFSNCLLIGQSPKFDPLTRYRCTPKPTCQVRNLDTGELKTMTREAAKKLQAELGDTVEWTDPEGCPPVLKYGFTFNFEGIYTYKLKANLVKLNSKLMSREAAIAEWESKKDTCDIWYKSNSTSGEFIYASTFRANTTSDENAEYELRERPLKQISWKDVPVGVALTVGTLIAQSAEGSFIYLAKDEVSVRYIHPPFVPTLAPADQQPWIAVQDDTVCVEGLIYKWSSMGEMYRITGIAKGYELK